MRLTRLVSMLGLGLGVMTAGPSCADTVLLADGGLLTGEVEGTDLSLANPDGVATVGLRDLQVVRLDTLGGDVLIDKKGAVATGRVEQASYTIRLPSGQTVVVPRGLLSEIRLTAR